MKIISKSIYVIFVSIAFASSAFAAVNPLERLLAGNKRFVAGAPARKEIGEKRRRELARGQHPFAIVLSCSDSSVPPEMIFDQGLGDLFVIRDAGNVADPVVIGSIEYAVEHLHVPLLVVLGHSGCGAVKATLEARKRPAGNFGSITDEILPAVVEARKSHKTDILNEAVQDNVKNTCSEIVRRSKVIQYLVSKGKFSIVAAEYYTDTGKVEPVPSDPSVPPKR